jgi:hypothetical protein
VIAAISKHPAVMDSTAASESKTIATAKAQCALAGFAVYELTVGGYLVARHDCSRHLPDARALVAFAQGLASG